MASRKSVSLRVPQDAHEAISSLAKRSGRDFSSIANEMLTEAVKMRRVPGIVFADGPAGRRARIAGTGLEVYEVVGVYRRAHGDWGRLREAYHWLTEQQLRAALAYADAYPDEIDARLAEEERWTPERVWGEYPFMRPRRTAP